MLTFDVDAEVVHLTTDPANARRAAVRSLGAYGPTTGLPRILDLLERHGVRATFFVPGLVAELHPEVVPAILAAGHEIGHHGHRHLRPDDLDEEQELEELETGLEVLRRQSGLPAFGYRAPWWSPSLLTPSLLVRLGFLYDSSLMEDDRPYWVQTASGRLMELPVTWELDDWEQYGYVPDPPTPLNIEEPDKVYRHWVTSLDAYVRYGGLFVLTCHPQHTGRPVRVATLDRFLEHVLSRPDVWVATGREVLEFVRGESLPVRPVFYGGEHPARTPGG